MYLLGSGLKNIIQKCFIFLNNLVGEVARDISQAANTVSPALSNKG